MAAEWEEMVSNRPDTFIYSSRARGWAVFAGIFLGFLINNIQIHSPLVVILLNVFVFIFFCLPMFKNIIMTWRILARFEHDKM